MLPIEVRRTRWVSFWSQMDKASGSFLKHRWYESLLMQRYWLIFQKHTTGTKKIGHDRRNRQFFSYALHNIDFWNRFVVQNKSIIQDIPLQEAWQQLPDVHNPVSLLNGIDENMHPQSDSEPMTKALPLKLSYHPRCRKQVSRCVLLLNKQSQW